MGMLRSELDFTNVDSILAGGLHESVTGTPTTALSMMVRAAGLLEPVGRGVLLPDSPAALGALLALHYGELGTASSLLEKRNVSCCFMSVELVQPISGSTTRGRSGS